MNLDDTLRDKQTANGPFEDTAQIAQALKFALRRGRNWEPMGPESKEALEQIATQIAKILNGDANDFKHWNHIAGYARLRGRALEQGSLEKDVSRVVRARIPIMERAKDELGDA